MSRADYCTSVLQPLLPSDLSSDDPSDRRDSFNIQVIQFTYSMLPMLLCVYVFTFVHYNKISSTNQTSQTPYASTVTKQGLTCLDVSGQA
jgi:hypothetical protein